MFGRSTYMRGGFSRRFSWKMASRSISTVIRITSRRISRLIAVTTAGPGVVAAIANAAEATNPPASMATRLLPDLRIDLFEVAGVNQDLAGLTANTG